MNYYIDSNNFSQYLQNGNSLVVNSNSVQNLFSNGYTKITIQSIPVNTLYLLLEFINLPTLQIEVNNCFFLALAVKEIFVDQLTFHDVQVSESRPEEFTLFKTSVDTSQINNLWFFKCKLYNTLIIRKETGIGSLRLDGTFIDRSFVFANSKCDDLTINSSNILAVNIDRTDTYDKKGETEIKTLNIFRTEGIKTIRIWETEFKNLHFHKILFLRSESLNYFNNEIHIHAPENYTDIEEIKISDSNILAKTIISTEKIKNLKIFDSNLDKLILNYGYIDNMLFSKCVFDDSLSFGQSNKLKKISKLEIENCTFEDTFNMSCIQFEKKAFFRGLIFKKYPSFFHDILIAKNCNIDFKYSNLENVIFQDTDFEFFTFKDFDITNVEFRNCFWKEEKKHFITRNIIIIDADKTEDIDNRIKLKDIYVKLKLNSQKSSDFINYGKFYISEQETKRRIHYLKKDWTEYILLGFHKAISSYGENFKKPLFFVLLLVFVFATLFMFTGFYVGERLVEYDFAIDASNLIKTANDFRYAFVYSLKNVVPFQTSLNFYLHSEKNLQSTQTLELLHKLINLILATSFTAAFVRYLRK